MCDNYGAAFEMMERIISSGRKQIVTLGIDRCFNRKRRIQGFYDAMLKHGMTDADKRKFVMHHGSLHENRIMLQKILRQFPDVDFIATDSDDVVYNIMQIWGAERDNWRMKTGISGFGNIHGISDLHKIPTIEQHPWHIGSEAVRALLKLAANGKPAQPVKIQVPAELVNAEFI